MSRRTNKLGTGHLKHWLSQAIPASSAVDALPAACPVHRLDALTGGLALCARTLTAAQRLTQAFEDRQVKKQYVALLAGRYQPSSSTTATAAQSAAAVPAADNTDNPSVRYDSSSGITTINPCVAGKPASTALRVLSQTPSLKFDWITTAQLCPTTGRKHQLRQHMSALGHPILGDPLYNQFAGNGVKLAGKGMWLWAQRLEFDHPLTGRLLQIGTEEPARFEKVRQHEAQRHAKFAVPEV
ncbi:hypothetical protein OEZ86_010693 [Tetradesmus obliquus]|nr:hypothetical protein OEZ86_010693 [Tetradesmus obliquus]